MVIKTLERPNSFGFENIMLEFSPHREERILSQELFDVVSLIMELRSYDVFDAMNAVASFNRQIIGEIREHKRRGKRVFIAEA